MSKTLELAQRLIARESITPNDAGCQRIIADYLTNLGFKNESLPFGDVENLWSTYGSEGPLLTFIGHTDVVPPGPIEQWTTPPFEPTIRDNKLYGRGAADMKSSIAAMIIAIEHFLNNRPKPFIGRLSFLITSDEEGPSIHGTRKVIEYLSERGEKIDWCLVGECSSEKKFGDTIKIGRRGSLSGQLKIFGKQGHIAYPLKADNPIHRFGPALNELIEQEWDKGNADFPPTSFQISNIHAGTGANNVIPGQLDIDFNFRYSTESTRENLQNRLEGILKKHSLDYNVQWHHSGDAFLCQAGSLRKACLDAIKKETGIQAICSTGGGTSDGRFIAPTGAEVVEFGPINSSIHKIDEHTDISELEGLVRIYQGILERLF